MRIARLDNQRKTDGAVLVEKAYLLVNNHVFAVRNLDSIDGACSRDEEMVRICGLCDAQILRLLRELW